MNATSERPQRALLTKELRDALATLNLSDAQISVHAHDLAEKIAVAWLTHGIHGGPKTATISQELAHIEELSRKLHRAVRRPSSAAETAMAKKAGGIANFQVLRRKTLLALNKLHTVSNQSVATRGRRVDRYARAVADACATIYTSATGRKPGRSVNPVTGKVGGRFYRFVSRVFTIANVRGAAVTQVNRIVAGVDIGPSR
jgi:hypothetical protein